MDSWLTSGRSSHPPAWDLRLCLSLALFLVRCPPAFPLVGLSIYIDAEFFRERDGVVRAWVKWKDVHGPVKADGYLSVFESNRTGVLQT